MSELNYITELLELKDNNIKFYQNCYHKEKIKEITHKIFESVLTYQPTYCEKYGIALDFRSFRRFKARIMICKGLIKISKEKANAYALAS